VRHNELKFKKNFVVSVQTLSLFLYSSLAPSRFKNLTVNVVRFFIGRNQFLGTLKLLHLKSERFNLSHYNIGGQTSENVPRTVKAYRHVSGIIHNNELLFNTAIHILPDP
jgi:hypothetical protein